MHIYVSKPKGNSFWIVVGFLLVKILLDQALTQVFYSISGHIFSLLF